MLYYILHLKHMIIHKVSYLFKSIIMQVWKLDFDKEPLHKPHINFI